jgi:hypothetical protein
MRWTTREHIHFDRAISAWLIKRFVDHDASFTFGNAVDDPPPTPFGVPGVELSSHDAGGSTFHKILVKYELIDPALHVIDDLVAQCLTYLFSKMEPDIHAFPGEVVMGLLAIVEGLVLASGDDDEAFEKSLILYDALYALVQARILSKDCDEAAGIAKMGPGLWRTAFAVTLAGDLRTGGGKLGPHSDPVISDAFAPALQRLHDR